MKDKHIRGVKTILSTCSSTDSWPFFFLTDQAIKKRPLDILNSIDIELHLWKKNE